MTLPLPNENALYATGAKMALANGRTIDLADLSTIPEALDLSCWARGMCSLARWRGQTPELWLVAQHSSLVAYIALELYSREVPREEWDLDDIWTILWCGVLHDCEEALIGDPPRGMSAVPELGPALSRFKRRVRAVVADTLTRELGVDPLPSEDSEAARAARLWNYVHRADSTYAIDLERRACPTPPDGCATLNDADALAFTLSPEHAAVLAAMRGQVEPWRLPFELAHATLVRHMRNLAGLRDAAWREAEAHLSPARALMALARAELESVFSAGVLGDDRVAVYERRDGGPPTWLVDARGSIVRYPDAPQTPEGWAVYSGGGG